MVYVKKTLDGAYLINHLAEEYFAKMYNDVSCRKQSYRDSAAILDDKANVKVGNFYHIIKSQMVELQSLSILHDKNLEDFEEIKGIGRSEIVQDRKFNQQNSRSKRFMALAVGIFSVIAFYETQILKTEVNNLQENQQVIRHVLKESLSLINITRIEVEPSGN